MRSLRLRDARPADRKTVLEFCRNTWPGYGDYMQLVWPRWIGEKKGRFILAELDGRPVGTAKISEFSKGEVWLQGLRVDPALRGKGIANEINYEVLRTVKSMKPRKVRFCTATRNWASRHIGEKFGFDLVVRARFFWAKSRKGSMKGRAMGMGEMGAALDFIENSRNLKLSRGMIAEGWVFREFSPELLRKYLRDGAVHMIEGKRGIRGLAIYTEDEEEPDTSVFMGFVDGDANSIKALARNAFYLAAKRGLPYCSASVPTRYFARLLRWSVFGKSETVGQVVYELDGEKLRGM